jgi:hypothetical protein
VLQRWASKPKSVAALLRYCIQLLIALELLDILKALAYRIATENLKGLALSYILSKGYELFSGKCSLVKGICVLICT